MPTLFKIKKEDGDAKEIEALRAKARQYRDANNSLANKIRDLDSRIRKAPEVEKAPLREEREQLSLDMRREAYDKKYDKLIEEIIEKEIALYGYSELNTSSPYQL